MNEIVQNSGCVWRVTNVYWDQVVIRSTQVPSAYTAESGLIDSNEITAFLTMETSSNF